MSLVNTMTTSIPEPEDAFWTLQDLPDAQVVHVNQGEIKEEKLISFYESFSAAMDLPTPENVIDKS